MSAQPKLELQPQKKLSAGNRKRRKAKMQTDSYPDSPFVNQSQRILNHLLDVGSISGVEAQAMYKARSLTKRISELRAQGWDIKAEWNRDHTGQRYVRYWLRSKTKRTV